MRRLAAILALLAAVALAHGCAKKSVAPVAPPAPVPPGFSATQPAPFATNVIYDAPIWAQFDRPLDATTVDSTTVYLKIDTRRQPVDVRYEPFTRRVMLTPRQTLALRTTYTVEFSAGLRDTGGVALGRALFFQFTTNTMRRPRYDYPAPGDWESPYAHLGWGITAVSGSSINYQLYVGTDSAAVAARQVAPLQNGVRTNYQSWLSWPRGARLFWAVTATNLTYDDRLDGAVQSFRVFPTDWPVDSLVLPAQDWSGIDPTRFQYCTYDRCWTGPQGVFSSGMRFAMANRATLRLDQARLELRTMAEYADSIASPSHDLSVWLALADWNPCAARLPGPPNVDASRRLATGIAGTAPRTVVFTGDSLSFFFETQARRGGVWGVVFEGSSEFPYFTNAAGDPADRPRLVLRYFLPPAAALARRRVR